MSLKFFQWEPNCFTQTNGWTDGQTDGQTDMLKLIVYFRKIANAPKNVNTGKMLTVIFMIDSGA
jgi:ABC-type sugar transport system permease subunit